jgi:hypothetical protein
MTKEDLRIEIRKIISETGLGIGNRNHETGIAFKKSNLIGKIKELRNKLQKETDLKLKKKYLKQ